MGWGGYHITLAQNVGEFLKQAQSQEWAALEWAQLLAKQKRVAQKSAQNEAKKGLAAGRAIAFQAIELGCLWSNRDFELSQKINAQNWTCRCGLQNTCSKKLALKLDSF
jgi:hypothetical protein